MSVRVHCTPAAEAGVVVVAFAGDLDLDAEEQVVQEVARVLGDGAPAAAVLDLGDVDFIDSSGVRALLRLRRTHGDRVRLGTTSHGVRRVLDIAGITELFDDAPSTNGTAPDRSEGGR